MSSNSLIYTKEDFVTLESTKVIELEPSFLTYNKDLEVLICSSCSLVIINTKTIKKHLKEKHPSTKVTKEVLSKLESYSIKSYIDSTTNIPYNTYYFKDLPIILKGYKCVKCPFITTSYKKLRNHLVTIEGIKGTSTKKREDITITPIQLLYPSLNKGLFIPKLPLIGINRSLEVRITSTSRASPSPSPTFSSSTSSSILEEGEDPSSTNLFLNYVAKKEELSTKAKEVGEVSISTKTLSSFLKNSRFNLFLENKNIKDLLELIESTSKEDVLLDSIYTISYKLSYKISSLIPNILRFIRLDIKKDNSINNFLSTKDFIELESNTKKTYFKVFSNLLVFIIRLYLIDNHLRESINKDYISNNIDFGSNLNINIKALLNKLEVYNLEDKEEDSLKDIETFIIYIFIDLLKIPIKFTTLKEFNLFRNPTIVFFILATLDTRTLVFKEVRDISRLASIIIYNTRLYTIGFLSTIEDRDKNKRYNLEDIYYNLSNNYLKSNSKNYLGEIINIRNYTLKISKELVSKNRPILELDSNRLLVYNKEYSITGLSLLFKDLITKLKDILFKDLIDLDINTLPSINLSTIRDNPLISNLDYYILDNPNLESYKDYLVKVLLESKSKLNKRYIKKVINNKPIFNISKVNKFYSTRKEFIELLTLALYLTTSSPLRGEELVNLIYKNTRDNIRNIIFNKEEELIVITTSYYKSYNITRKNKENIRFLNKDLSTILIYYLVYVIPLYYYFNIEFLEVTTLSPYLLENKGKPISSTTLSTTLYKISSSYFREGLTINPYRHLINYIIKEYLGYNIDLEEEEEEEEDNIIDLLANRTTKVGNLSYSREVNISTTKDIYLRSLRLCLDYFKFFNIENNSLKDLDTSIISSNNSLILLERSHKSKSNNKILDLLDNLKNPKIKLLEEYLREFFKDPNTSFRDIYLPKALDLVLNNKFTYLTYINKTSSGKSLLFLLPTFIKKSNIYLVFTPRISLKENLYNRAREQNLPSYILEDLDFTNLSSIPIGLILGSIDNILGSNLETFLRLISKTNISITIFLDEIHTLILEANYRPILKYINSLLKYRVPLVFISATLPCSLLGLLNKEFFLEPKDNIIIQGPLNREDISYNITSINSKLDVKDNILSILKIFKAKGLGPQRKALIFINNTNRGLVLSKDLDIEFYYSNNPYKDSILKTFLEPNSKSLVLLTTSSLSIGVDFNIIAFTLHLEPLYSLIDYIQESSRIRNKGYSYILSNTKPTFSSNLTQTTLVENNITTLEEFKALDKAYMNLFLKETKCLKGVINRFLDPSTTYFECHLSKELGCSLCLNRKEKLVSKAIVEEDNLKTINLGLVNLEEKLVGLKTSLCFICLLEVDISQSSKHYTSTCPYIKKALYNNSSIYTLSTSFKEFIKEHSLLKANSSCFSCLFPSRICTRLKEANNSTSCIYLEVLFIIISIIIFNILKDLNKSTLYFNL
jgi:superfamily II DNA helicase RecQ